jgi:uncharacterized protein (DUF433 family)
MEKTAETQNMIVRTSRGLTVAGTRTTLYFIMDFLKDDWPPHLIQDWLNLSDEQIQGALNYIEDHQEEVEAEYQQVILGAAERERYWRKNNQEHLKQMANVPPKPEMAEAWAKLQAWKKSLGMS